MNEDAFDDTNTPQRVNWRRRVVIPMEGKKFHRLTVLRDAGSERTGKREWVCECDCGKTVTVDGYSLRNGNTKSCGCLVHERYPAHSITHGMTNTGEFNAWMSMRGRCNSKTHHAYPSYGGRGISVCSRWDSFQNFYADMGPRPEGMTIERRDNDGDYEPSNCVWATRIKQQRNRRTNRILTVNGISKCVSEWAEEIGIPFNVIHDRRRLGWSDEKAVTTPYKPRKKS